MPAGVANVLSGSFGKALGMVDRSYELAGLRFDREMGLLAGPRGNARLEPRAADVLALLCKERGSLVARQRLLDACWGEAAGSDEALTQAIAQIRRALETLGAPRDLLTTYPKRGYRLSPDTPMPAVKRGKAGARGWTTIAVLALVVAALLFILATRPGWPRHAIRHALGLGPGEVHHH